MDHDKAAGKKMKENVSKPLLKKLAQCNSSLHTHVWKHNSDK